MRNKLAALGTNYNGLFTGIIDRTGIKIHHNGNHKWATLTICIQQIRKVDIITDNPAEPSVEVSDELAQHIWVRTRIPYDDHDQFQHGDRVNFKGQVYSYTRGYHGQKQLDGHDTYTTDYSITFDQQVA